jgi:hypothetical protein
MGQVYVGWYQDLICTSLDDIEGIRLCCKMVFSFETGSKLTC